MLPRDVGLVGFGRKLVNRIYARQSRMCLSSDGGWEGRLSMCR
jgi:hypothetical protein